MNYDAKELNLMFGDDPEIFEEILKDFVDTKDAMLSEVSNAISTHNSDQLEISAHTLKGVLATFCSVKAKEIAKDLERMGKNAEFDGAQEMYKELDVDVVKLLESLKEHNFKNVA